MTIRALIADDEPVIRDGIVAAIRKSPDFEVVGACANGKQALTAIRESSPDVVFLDVQMPLLNGIEVARALEVESAPLVVFVTAYDHYAVTAFEVDALDFLVKPFTPKRLEATLQRVRETCGNKTELDALKRKVASVAEAFDVDGRSANVGIAQATDHIVASVRGRRIRIDVADIFWIEAAGNYVRVHGSKVSTSDTSKGRIALNPFVGSTLVRTTMKELEDRLSKRDFRRIHRSRIVNVHRVREVRPIGSGDSTLVLEDGTELVSSRTFRDERARLLGDTRQSKRLD